MEFPEEFLLSTGPAASIVKAEKYFKNTLAANAVDTNGLINGKNPLDAITLMDTQDWLGFPTFNHLEISEQLAVCGFIFFVLIIFQGFSNLFSLMAQPMVAMLTNFHKILR